MAVLVGHCPAGHCQEVLPRQAFARLAPPGVAWLGPALLVWPLLGSALPGLDRPGSLLLLGPAKASVCNAGAAVTWLTWWGIARSGIARRSPKAGICKAVAAGFVHGGLVFGVGH